MHYTILIISLIFSGSAFAESSLPPCEGEEYKQWVNCYGSYQKKLESNGKTFVRNYSGEFGNFPGKRAGKGKSQISQNGKLAYEYNGFFENDMSHGQGTITYADGSKYVGEWKNDKRNGQGTYTFADGSKYVGEWKDSYENGLGTYTFSPRSKWAGHKYVGEFKDGKYHGQGTYTNADGSKYVGEYKNGKRHGQGTWTGGPRSKWAGDKYVGEFKDSKYHGQGTFTYNKSGDKYVGQFENNKRNGQGTYTFADGEKIISNWYENKENGQGKRIFKNGKSKCRYWSMGAERDCAIPGLAEKKERKLKQAINCYRYIDDDNKKQLMRPHVDVLTKFWETLQRDPNATPSNDTLYQMIDISNRIIQIGGC